MPDPAPLAHIRERQHHPETAGIPGAVAPPERDVSDLHKGGGWYELPGGQVVHGADEARAALGVPDEPEPEEGA